ncbi:MAG: hypothetical protein V7676_17215 [Parasphingorhabdus sp.]|uniref:hypothetical protein n=1 Tax=Parasphingorhabdus sp. TaxID=2709688 RepID=UPI003002FA9F
MDGFPKAKTSKLESPYLAVLKPVPTGQSRIYLLAGIPGKIIIANNCVLFERLDRNIVLPVFEVGMTGGVDEKGAWLFDPVSNEYFRDKARVYGGGGGSGETIAELSARHVLQHRVPQRCSNALDIDTVVILNPGLKPAE